jgi:putative SOS response-associated peptidase YedK
MCANFQIEITDPKMMEIMKAALKTSDALDDDFSLLIKNKGEVFPSYTIPVQTAPETFQPMVWGYPQWKGTGVIFNARSEGAMESKMFRDSMERRRCVIPAFKYYEHKAEGKHKTKYYFQLPGKGIMYLAGCWAMKPGKRLPVCAILTRDAAGDLADIHNRMPVIIPPERVDEWLVESSEPMKQPTLWLDFGPVWQEEPAQMSLFDQNY